MNNKLKLLDLLQVKVNGKYVKSAQEVADYHGVHKNAVYQSRKNKKNPDRLDKLMLFDEALKIASREEEVGLTIQGSKEELLETLDRIMQSGKRYSVVLEEAEN